MSIENTIVRFNGKNFPTWEFQFKIFLKGKELSNHIDNSAKIPTDEKEFVQWEVKDAKVISWLLGTIESHLVTNLRCFTTAQAMWDYLHRIYHQDHSARKFQLELEISNYDQGNLPIAQFYSGFINIWCEYSAIVHTKVPITALAALQAVHAESQRDQFLMKLRPEFEPVRAGLLNRNPVPSLDICLGDLLREEQRLSTQIGMTSEKVFSDTVNVAYAAQGRGRNKLQCFSCKEFGHIARNCPKKVCNYCKKEGHLIKDFQVRPQNRQSQAFQAAVQSSSSSSAPPTVSSDSSVLTPAMVQQMIVCFYDFRPARYGY
ncbi:uncharacterized protein LOC121267141 [Juglans microcarpa x Juglans regia]|uniref:uncharacterized protein LOC121267141 n=1 Tax=Juglans microcarpa x Juglans regia TaxID=2249226 RepID=UPI001B7F1330|nr:uncharacterized protein LOC121267141 [Juglans microcarpa x Juglans regia]